MNLNLVIYLMMLSMVSTLSSFQSKAKIEQLSAQQSRVEIECHLEPNQVLFHNSLRFSCNVPGIRIAKWFAIKQPDTYFDPRSQKSEQVYSGSVTFIVTLDLAHEIPLHAVIHMHYETNLGKNPHEAIFRIGAGPEEKTQPEKAVSSTLSLPKPPHTSDKKSSWAQNFDRIRSDITNTIQSKELPLIFKFFLAFLIGLIMSLTPCIYPMIPITMGILQANKSRSIVHSFLLACAYTAGLSITFAILGMIAAYGGAQFGSAMGSPWIIVPIVIFFAYLGFSMLGFYEMYIPRFMRPRHGHKNNGSFISAFTFGMINGTVASPCLSPGLALILGIVTGLANPILGFLLLFIFGVGSSFPLLIIGTFSSSLHILPRAGMWMVEFKKIFGFLLLGMCAYYLKPFMFEWVYYLVLGCYIVIMASYYLNYGFNHRSWIGKITGLVLCLVAAFTLTESYRMIWRSKTGVQESVQKIAWKTGYDDIMAQAQAENKLVLLDFTAVWCTSCKILDKQFFSNPVICQELPERVIPLKIDCSDPRQTECSTACKKFGVMGYPAIILINPKTQTILRRWDSDLNNKDPHEFITEIDSFKTA